MSDFQHHEEAIFVAALPLSAAQRAAYLDQACAGNPRLRRRVEGLLQAHEKAGAFLETPPGGVQPFPPVPVPTPAPPVAGATVLLSLPSLEKAGDKIGRYKVREKIGEGGCGVVYVAEQEEPVRRRVALKVIKLGMDTKSVIARFEAERQALAMMDHPNIAKVLDAGATEAGRPFFVMELVRGIRITDYCDQNKLTTADRLDLFMKVCQAVQHAHQKGIIHRDLKPSNILVTLHDGVPVPKIIDFGIAKATEGRLTDMTVYTELHQFIGTPAYMSPEQAEMSGLDIDTRSDIYSLGVLLYELLTGKTPFDTKTLMEAGLDEIRRIIREDEPPRPSTRLSTMLDADLTAVAKRQSSESPRLVRLIRGDLDWIVMRALEKDRTRRYETANALAVDIKRHLDNEAIIARPPSNLYRFQKMIRRNKLAFVAASAVIVSVLVGLGLSTYSFVREKKANDAAQSAAKKSQQVAGFLQDMIKGIGPEVAKGEDTKMLRAIVDKTADRIGTELAGQPEVEAELRSTIGKVYYDLGALTNAAEMQTDLLGLVEKCYGKESTNTASAIQQLAATMLELHEYPKTEELELRAIDIWRKTVGTNDGRLALTLNDLGLVHAYRGELAQAEDLLRQGMAIRLRLPGDNREDLRESFNNLGMVLCDRGNLAEAANADRKGLDLERALHPEGTVDEAILLNNLANILQNQGDFAGAQTAYQESLLLLTKLIPDDQLHLDLVRSHLSAVTRRRGAVAGDPSLFRQALQLNPVDPFTADALVCSIADSTLTPLADDPRSAPITWHYSVAEPSADWAAPDFSDDTWSSSAELLGSLAYSSRSGRAVPVYTNLWLRREFELPDLPAGKLVLRVKRDQDAQVYLNGVQLAPVVDWSDASVIIPCSTAGQAALKRGRNVLAFHCQDADGGARLGVGIYLTQNPRLGQKQLVEYFGQMIKNEPARAELYAGRASALARMGLWHDATADLTKSIELRPSMEMNWCQLAPLLVATGDLMGYQRYRRNALEQFAKPGDPNIAERVAKLSLLLPAEGAEIQQAEILADVSVRANYADWNLPWRQFTKGLAEYRLGHYAGAIEWTDKALATSARQDQPGWNHERERNRNAAAYLVQAMAYQQLRSTVKARDALLSATTIIKNQFPNAESGDIGREWQDWLVARILSGEAQAMIEGTSPASILPTSAGL
ncbi:MAG TPA: protein kinase [Verrucomicrobiae bacterium]|nr:protein kinase [Verrucomicrobiae bacterium]